MAKAVRCHRLLATGWLPQPVMSVGSVWTVVSAGSASLVSGTGPGFRTRSFPRPEGSNGADLRPLSGVATISSGEAVAGDGPWANAGIGPGESRISSTGQAGFHQTAAASSDASTAPTTA